MTTSLGMAQLTQEELEQRKAKIQQEILDKERMLQEVRSKEKSVTKLLDIQKEKIGLKEKLINTTNKQARIINDNLYLNQLEINKLKKDLEGVMTEQTVLESGHSVLQKEWNWDIHNWD